MISHKLLLTIYRRSALCLLWLCCAATAQAAPHVVASIKPLQLIAAAITDGVSTPQVLMTAGQDPHHLSLRPSERQALEQADLVLWVGPALEIPLAKIIAQSSKRVITVQTLAGMTVLKSGNEIDPHLWLDSHNGRRIASELVTALQQLDVANAAHYQANLDRFVAALATHEADFVRRFAALQQQSWTVSHQAFRYLAEQYRLQTPLALTDSNNTSASVQRVLQLRGQMDQQQARCFVTEPSDNTQKLDALIEGKRVTLVSADTMGLSFAVTANSYVALLRDVSNTIAKCLGNQYE